MTTANKSEKAVKIICGTSASEELLKISFIPDIVIGWKHPVEGQGNCTGKKRCNSVFEKSSELLKCQFEITSVNTAVIFFSFMPLCFILQGIEYFRYLRDHLLKVFIASSIA